MRLNVMRLNTDVTLAEFYGWSIDDRKRYLDWLVGLPFTSRNPVERRWKEEWARYEASLAPDDESDATTTGEERA